MGETVRVQQPRGYVVVIDGGLDEVAAGRVVSALAAVEGVAEVRPIGGAFESVPEMFRLDELRERVLKAVNDQFRGQWDG